MSDRCPKCHARLGRCDCCDTCPETIAERLEVAAGRHVRDFGNFTAKLWERSDGTTMLSLEKGSGYISEDGEFSVTPDEAKELALEILCWGLLATRRPRK